MILETERLILRPWKESDAESLYEYAKDPDVGPIAGWPTHQSVEESRTVIKEEFSIPECYAICEKENDIAIGAIALKLNGQTDMTERDDECEVGYWLGKPFWGRGYMPEAAREIIRHGFEDLGMTTIWCGYYDGNEKSRRVQEKVGFIYHHTYDEVPVPLLNEVRVGHTNYLTKESWMIERINKMEFYFDVLQNVAKEDPSEIKRNDLLQEMYQRLMQYYENGLWMHDFKADEKGLLPKELKRGVLSEDGVYNLLTQIERS